MSMSSVLKAVWIPRALAGLLIAFFLVMSLDVFDGSKPVGAELLAYLIQVIPAIVVGIALGLSWKVPRVAGGLFLVLAVFFTMFFSTYVSPVSFVTLSLIPALIGIWFLASAARRT